MSKVAVVILNWNGEEHLKTFLPSVVESVSAANTAKDSTTNLPIEISLIVADNGSTDASIRLLNESFKGVEVVRMDNNYGFAAGYNLALKGIDADYYILLNSDVETPNGWIEPLISELENDRQLAAVSPKILSYIDKNSFEYAGASGGYIDYLGYPFCRGRILNTTEYDEGQYDDAKDLFWVSGAAFCCRADIFQELGGFDSDFFAHMEEIDLCWRMQLAGYKVRIVPQSYVYHLGGGTLSTESPNKVFFNHRNNLAMLYKCSSPTQRAVVAVVRPMLDMLAALSHLVRGDAAKFGAVIRAYRDFICWHGKLSKKRALVRGINRVHESKHIYCGSIVMRYIFGKKYFGKLM